MDSMAPDGFVPKAALVVWRKDGGEREEMENCCSFCNKSCRTICLLKLCAFATMIKIKAVY